MARIARSKGNRSVRPQKYTSAVLGSFRCPISVVVGFDTGWAQSDSGADARHHSSDWKASELVPGSDAASSWRGVGGRSIWSRSSLFELSIWVFSDLGLRAAVAVTFLSL